MLYKVAFSFVFFYFIGLPRMVDDVAAKFDDIM